MYDEARGREVPRSAEPKDYSKINIQNAVRAVPRQPPAKAVDTRRGSSLLLETSGLEPKYIFKKVPTRALRLPRFVVVVARCPSVPSVCLSLPRTSRSSARPSRTLAARKETPSDGPGGPVRPSRQGLPALSWNCRGGTNILEPLLIKSSLDC